MILHVYYNLQKVKTMNVAIIFHSVCGNTYFMAKRFKEAFRGLDCNVNLYRAADADLEKWGKIFPVAGQVYDELSQIPIAEPEAFIQNDLIVLGSPTYFGNVSAEMKAVMDSTSIYWLQAALAGKKLAVFTSSASKEGGAALCLKSLITFGQHMGMIHIPLPSNLLPGYEINAYGITHYSGELADSRPDEALYKIIDSYSNYLAKSV
jgi:NAD(P)H dehydrogenase (quinone)